MKNVEKTLEYFSRPDSKYENCLCTGNIQNGAKQKLVHYKLDKYFNFNHSVFGELAEERTELAKYALHRLYLEDRSTLPKDSSSSAILLTMSVVPMPLELAV